MKIKERSINNILILLGLIVLSYAIAKIFIMVSNVYSISTIYSAQNEVRDYVSFRLADYILQGKNPYTMDMLTEYNVPFMCLYTALQPLLVAFVCKITGFSILRGYYDVNILLVVLTAFNVWLTCEGLFKKNRVLFAVCIFINTCTFFSLFGLPIFNFHTDTIGIYITSLIILIVRKNENLIWPLALLTVALIFTKQILVVFAVPLFCYYLIRNRKNALIYFLECAGIGVLAYIVIQIFFPLYWTETIYCQFITSGNYGMLKTAINNIIQTYQRYSAYVLILLIAVFYFIFKGIKSNTIKILFRKLFEEHSFLLYLSLNIIWGTIFLLYFAKCEGDGYKYCQDILAPSVFLLGVYTLSLLANSSLKKITSVKSSAVFLLLAVATVFTYSRFGCNIYTKDDVNDIIKLNELISEHKDEKIYLGLDSDSYMLGNNLWDSKNIWYDDGQIEYFNVTSNGNSFLTNFFYNEEIEEAACDYVDEVNDMVRNKEFSLITSCIDNVIDSNILKQNYYQVESYSIKTETNGVFEVSAWLPK